MNQRLIAAPVLAALVLAAGEMFGGPAAGELPEPPVGSEMSPTEMQDECLRRWEAAEENGLTRGTAIYEGALTVLIDEATWNAADREEKLRMVGTLECAFVGPGGELVRVDFRDARTDEVLGEWRWGDLYRPGHRRPVD